MNNISTDLTVGKIAVLVDADNAQRTALKAALDEISKYGRIIAKRAYGDWDSDVLKNWEAELKRLAIKPVQQFAYTTGKNATDIALVIDAMDLLYTGNYDGFVIISSDSDYTPLAIRLRETGAYVFGIGNDNTPMAFRNSCDNFILTSKLLDSKEEMPPNNDASGEVPSKKSLGAYDISEIHKLLKSASVTYQDEDGWVNTATVGNYIKRARSDLELQTYGFFKWSDLLKAYPDLYETEFRIDGKVKKFVYKLK
jgi:uncharacterized protein (TIGR00288 family)